MGSFEAGKRLISTAEGALSNRKRVSSQPQKGLFPTAKGAYFDRKRDLLEVHWNVICCALERHLRWLTDVPTTPQHGIHYITMPSKLLPRSSCNYILDVDTTTSPMQLQLVPRWSWIYILVEIPTVSG